MSLIKHVVMLSDTFQDGGVERYLLNTAIALESQGVKVDVIIPDNPDSPFVTQIPDTIQCFSYDKKKVSFEKKLAGYLQEFQPDVLLPFRSRNYVSVIRLRKALAPSSSLILVTGAIISHRLEKPAGLLKRLKWQYRIHRYWVKADGVICISEDLAENWRNHTPFKRVDIHVLPNPVLSKAIYAQAKAVPDHPWFNADGVPVILGVGRLGPQKNFSLLLNAFEHVLKQRACKLVILGKGPHEQALKAQASAMGINEHVDFPGFCANPYQYMARASVFVLSSASEPYGLVLIESLALGTRVVSTDCPVGPKGILENGKYGRLVPLGDPEAMSEAILKTLDEQPDKSFLQQAVQQHTIQNSGKAWLACLNGIHGAAR